MSLAIIPARGGSTRIPRKNIKLFHGKPIIAYSIETAIASQLFTEVIVSTEDEEIADVAKQFGATVVMRDPYFSQNEVGTQEVIRHVLKQTKYKGTYVCGIYPTSPLLSILSLKYGLLAMRAVGESSGEHGFAVSVGTEPLRDAGQFYWGTTDAFACGDPLWWSPTIPVPINEPRICDINTPEDWARAEQMYKELHKP